MECFTIAIIGILFFCNETFLTKIEIALRPDDDEMQCPYSNVRIIDSY